MPELPQSPSQTSYDAPIESGVGETPTKQSASTRWRYRRGPSAKRNAIEWAVIILGAAGVALVLRFALFQAFYIPSGSMLDTLQIGDRVLVSKVSYKLHDINRGDIVVFEKPSTAKAQQCYNESGVHDLIKRVIGLPGETIESRDGTIYINNKALTEPYIKSGSVAGDKVEKQVVPQDSIFVMGDNRQSSNDSRCAGPIPQKDVVGHAFMIMWPVTSLRWL